MIIGFSKHGTGGAAGAVQYLTAEEVGQKPLEYLTGEKGRRRVRREPSPVVVRGDPGRTKALIDSLSFKHKYTSGVLSFAPGEKITPEMEESIIEQFERAAYAGLEPDQYDILWVRHQHTSGGRHELHFLTPRVELTSGKSLHIAPPRKSTREVFDTLRSKINAEFGLADPDDPTRAQKGRKPGFRAKFEARNRKTDQKKDVVTQPDPKRAGELELLLQKLVQSRADYHHERYPAPPEPSQTHLLYDRTGTSPIGRVETPGNAIHGARPGICEHAAPLERAVERWSQACGTFERAAHQFDSASRHVARAAEQEIAVQTNRQATAALLSKYAVMQRSQAVGMERSRGTEMEMEISR